MAKAENINPEKEPIPASWVPRVITGGKGPPDGNHPDWLKDLPPDTVFVAKHNNSVVEYNQYMVVFHQPPVMLLAWKLPDGKILDYHVDTAGFSRMNSNYTVLGSMPMANKEEEDG